MMFKRKIKETVAVILCFAVLFWQIASAFAAWDGYQLRAEYGRDITKVLVPMDNPSDIFKTGAVWSRLHTVGQDFCLRYNNHTKVKLITINSVPRDWSDCDRITMDIWSEKKTDEIFTLAVYHDLPEGATKPIASHFYDIQVNWTGMKTIEIKMDKFLTQGDIGDWSKVQYATLSICRWAGTADPEGELYINNVYGHLKLDPEIEEAEERKLINEALEDGVAIENFSAYYMKNDEILPISDNLDKVTTDISGQPMVPIAFFERALHAECNVTDNSASVTLGEKTASMDNLPVKNEMVYVPVCEVAEQLGLYAENQGLLTIIGKKESSDTIFSQQALVDRVLKLIGTHRLSPDQVTQDDWDMLKAKWVKYMVGDEERNSDLSNEHVKSFIDGVNNGCRETWASLNKNSTDRCLFGNEIITGTKLMRAHYSKIQTLARGYATYGSEYYHNEELAQDVIFALDWSYDNLFGDAEIEDRGWKSLWDWDWNDWYIGNGMNITKTILLLGDKVSREQTEKWMKPSIYVQKVMRTDREPSIAASRVQLGTLSALVMQDLDWMSRLVDDYELLIEFCDADVNGWHEDGTYVTHVYYAYNNGYGHGSICDRLVPVLTILAGTKFEPQTSLLYNVMKIMNEGFAAHIFNNGCITNATAQRMRYNEPYNTSFPLLSYIQLYGVFGENDDAEIEKQVKRIVRDNLGEDTYKDITRMLSVPEWETLNNILAKESISDEPYERSKVYYTGDVVTHIKKDFGFAVAMSSERLATWESINGSNMNGWYNNEGTVLTYTDSDPYAYTQINPEGYWDLFNPYHTPGTTVDTQERVEANIAFGKVWLPNRDFVGGVELNSKYLTAAMDMESCHNDNPSAVVQTDENYNGDLPNRDCTLVAKKSWFMFDDELVALGADINADDGFEVQTVVENRIIRHREKGTGEVIIGEDNITVDGETMPEDETWTKTIVNPKWVHLENFGGYYFPDGGELVLDRVINKLPFIEMWFSHGISPKGGTYSYVSLPTKTAAEIQSYSENPDIQILANKPEVQAVKEKNLNTTGIVFWQSGKFNNITVSEPMIVMFEETEDGLEIAVSDPTHKLDKAELRITGNYEFSEGDTRISFSQGNTEAVITADFKDSLGRSLPFVLSSAK